MTSGDAKYPHLLSRYQDLRIRNGERAIYILRGNQGFGIWFGRFIELSKTGWIWELNEEHRHLKVIKNEDEYHQLARRFGRYKRARALAINELRSTQKQGDGFIGWQEVHDKVHLMRDGLVQLRERGISYTSDLFQLIPLS